MDDIITRFFEDLIARTTGPLSLRFFLQPAMATLFAIRDGVTDARQGRPAYFWAAFTDPAHRAELVREGWKSVGKIFILALLLDVAYQLIVFRWIHPVEALVVAAVLAFVPYLLLRGPVNRIARRWVHPGARLREGPREAA